MTLPEYTTRTGLIIVTLVLFSMFTGCGIAGRTAVTTVSSTSGTSHSLSNVQKELYRAHNEWKGTPYVLGGGGLNGVDCSSFIQIIFDGHFGITMPRNTRDQIREGSGVRRSAVRPGDLIFFRTSRKELHVGIAINGDEFLHASTSSGVMISSLSERYWATRFLGVRRVL